LTRSPSRINALSRERLVSFSPATIESCPTLTGGDRPFNNHRQVFPVT
jgi:hypothetical protein